MDIPHEKQFHFSDGSSVASLDELRNRIEHLSYQEFYKHVNAEKNDFASWVRHVLQDPKLASDMEKVSSIVETVEILNDYLHPRAATAVGDIQSQIEEQQDVHPPMDLEEVPTTRPAENAEPADLKVIEESIDSESTIEEPATLDEHARNEELGEERPEEKSFEDKFTLSAHEKKMLVVKDFIFGMIFGLIIGLILGRIITLG